MTMARYVLVIDKWWPATVNKMNRSVRTRIRLKKADRNLVCAYCLKNRIPVATGPRLVHLTVVRGKSQKGRDIDPDAPWKSLLDALVKAKMLIDDSRLYCRPGETFYERGEERGCRIELIDIH